MKILMIGTFPIASPKHGGQLRNRAIFDHYISEGHDVRYCGVSIVGWYDEYGEDDIIVEIKGLDVPLLDIAPEVATGQLLNDNRFSKRQFSKLLKDFKPDIIQFEQPYTYIGVKKILAEDNWTGKIIYSSHNIESELKKEMLLSMDVSEISQKKLRQKALKEVTDNELELVKRADLVITCTESDADALRNWGATKTRLVPNSAVKHVIDTENLQTWKMKLDNERVDKIILFVGSAHPPNLTGFKDLIGYKLGYIPRNTRIFIVGGVCDLLTHDLFYNVEPHVVTAFHLRARLLGMVENEDLATLLRLADTIVLPITQGGGSNLKTAEAILANKKIVATHTSFRSFEAHADNKNVTFADTPEEFKKAIIETLKSPKHNDDLWRRHVHSLTWKYALKGLAREVTRL